MFLCLGASGDDDDDDDKVLLLMIGRQRVGKDPCDLWQGRAGCVWGGKRCAELPAGHVLKCKLLLLAAHAVGVWAMVVRVNSDFVGKRTGFVQAVG
jgi:hypothetical protein